MSHYLCRLLDADGRERGVVPIIGSSLQEAKLTARAVYTAFGTLGSYELWNDATRVVVHGELEDLAPVAELARLKAEIKRR